MEKIEVQLIQKLRSTQLIQQQAYTELEVALNEARLPVDSSTRPS